MNKYLKFSLIGLLVVAIAGITAVGVAYAQDDPPRPHDALADLLGLTPEELTDLIQDGTTLEELADKAGIDLEEFWQSMQVDREVFFKSRLQEALDSGDISQDRFDWMMDGFENGFMGGGRGSSGFPGRSQSPDTDKSRPFDFGDGTRQFGGRGGFSGKRTAGSLCGMERINQ